MYLPLRIAVRYLFSKKSANAINIIAYITMGGIGIISLAFFVIMSVFNGFEGLVISLFNTFNPDLKLLPKLGKVVVYSPYEIAQLRKHPNVKSITFCLEENVLLRNGKKQCIARMKGVDADYPKVSNIEKGIVAGRYQIEQQNGYYTCLLGAGIEHVMGVDVDNPAAELDLYLPRRNADMGLSNPMDAFNMQTIYPTGSFSIQQDFDSRYLFVPFAMAKQLLDYDTLTFSSIEIKLNNEATLASTQDELMQIIGTKCRVLNRQQQDESLYNIMKLESWLVFALLSLVLVIASFNIISSLSMLIIEKKKDIAILKQLGATQANIRFIFLSVGVLMSVIGSSIGLCFGWLICTLQSNFGFIKIASSGSFVIDAYPVKTNAVDGLLVFLLVLIIAIVASWLPVSKISNGNVAFNER